MKRDAGLAAEEDFAPGKTAEGVGDLHPCGQGHGVRCDLFGGEYAQEFEKIRHFHDGRRGGQAGGLFCIFKRDRKHPTLFFNHKGHRCDQRFEKRNPVQSCPDVRAR